jgi:hypothetical protein
MERVYPSVTLDDLTPESFEQVPMCDAHLSWVRIGPIDGAPAYVTYHRSGPRIETLAFDVSAYRFFELEGWWSRSPIVVESEGARYIGDGWIRTHWLDRFPTRSEMITDMVLAAPDARISAHYANVPDPNPLPKRAYAWRTLERSRTH